MKVVHVGRLVVSRLIMGQICSVQARFLFCGMALDMSRETEASIPSCCAVAATGTRTALYHRLAKVGRAGTGDLLHG